LSDRPIHLRVLGPKGRWTIATLRGATAAASSGTAPGELILTPKEPAVDLRVELEFTGERVVTPRGEVIAAGKPYRFAYEVFEPAIDWTVNFWTFDAASDPLTQPAAFAARLKTPPVRTLQLTRLAYANAQAFGTDSPRVSVSPQSAHSGCPPVSTSWSSPATTAFVSGWTVRSCSTTGRFTDPRTMPSRSPAARTGSGWSTSRTRELPR
jgi:hypothetical protein